MSMEKTDANEGVAAEGEAYDVHAFKLPCISDALWVQQHTQITIGAAKQTNYVNTKLITTYPVHFYCISIFVGFLWTGQVKLENQVKYYKQIFPLSFMF